MSVRRPRAHSDASGMRPVRSPSMLHQIRSYLNSWVPDDNAPSSATPASNAALRARHNGTQSPLRVLDANLAGTGSLGAGSLGAGSLDADDVNLSFDTQKPSLSPAYPQTPAVRDSPLKRRLSATDSAGNAAAAAAADAIGSEQGTPTKRRHLTPVSETTTSGSVGAILSALDKLTSPLLEVARSPRTRPSPLARASSARRQRRRRTNSLGVRAPPPRSALRNDAASARLPNNVPSRAASDRSTLSSFSPPVTGSVRVQKRPRLRRAWSSRLAPTPSSPARRSRLGLITTTGDNAEFDAPQQQQSEQSDAQNNNGAESSAQDDEQAGLAEHVSVQEDDGDDVQPDWICRQCRVANAHALRFCNNCEAPRAATAIAESPLIKPPKSATSSSSSSSSSHVAKSNKKKRNRVDSDSASEPILKNKRADETSVFAVERPVHDAAVLSATTDSVREAQLHVDRLTAASHDDTQHYLRDTWLLELAALHKDLRKDQLLLDGVSTKALMAACAENASKVEVLLSAVDDLRGVVSLLPAPTMPIGSATTPTKRTVAVASADKKITFGAPLVVAAKQETLCSGCSTANDADATQCSVCAADLAADAPVNAASQWKCLACTTPNDNAATSCSVCLAPKESVKKSTTSASSSAATNTAGNTKKSPKKVTFAFGSGSKKTSDDATADDDKDDKKEAAASVPVFTFGDATKKSDSAADASKSADTKTPVPVFKFGDASASKSAADSTATSTAKADKPVFVFGAPKKSGDGDDSAKTSSSDATTTPAPVFKFGDSAKTPATTATTATTTTPTATPPPPTKVPSFQFAVPADVKKAESSASSSTSTPSGGGGSSSSNNIFQFGAADTKSVDVPTTPATTAAATPVFKFGGATDTAVSTPKPTAAATPFVFGDSNGTTSTPAATTAPTSTPFQFGANNGAAATSTPAATPAFNFNADSMATTPTATTTTTTTTTAAAATPFGGVASSPFGGGGGTTGGPFGGGGAATTGGAAAGGPFGSAAAGTAAASPFGSTTPSANPFGAATPTGGAFGGGGGGGGPFGGGPFGGAAAAAASNPFGGGGGGGAAAATPTFAFGGSGGGGGGGGSGAVFGGGNSSGGSAKSSNSSPFGYPAKEKQRRRRKVRGRK